jgi:hypothetical protein
MGDARKKTTHTEEVLAIALRCEELDVEEESRKG